MPRSDSTRVKEITTLFSGAESLPYVVASAALALANKVVTRDQEAALSALNLTRAQHEVLTLLHYSPSYQMPLIELRRVALLPPASLSYTADVLEERGLIIREQDRQDRRASWVRITPEGRALTSRAIEALAAIDFGFSSLSEAEATQLSRLLSKLLTEGAGDPEPEPAPANGRARGRKSTAPQG